MNARSRSLRSRLIGGAGDALVVAVALAWLLGFGWYFFSQTLPNNSEWSRSELLANVHRVLLNNVWPLDDGQARTSGWRYFPQRLDLLATAGVILTGAWGLGHLGLRALECISRDGGVWRRFRAHRPDGQAREEPDAPSLARRASGMTDACGWAARTAFAFGLGLAAWSLFTMGLGLYGVMSRAVFGGVIGAAVLTEVVLRAVVRNGEPQVSVARERTPLLQRRFFTGSLLPPVVVLVVAPFLLAMLLGSLLPPTDFDVKEYHLQGPKEWYQQGRITFLPHNVYTSFPFLTEMLPLSAMVLRGDWYRGALAGQAVLMMFAPLTALGLVAAGRCVSPAVGWLAALVYLTTPWVYRISVIAYAEGGLACYLLLSVLAMMVVIGEMRGEGGASRGGLLLAGLMAGSAMACKYPGLLSVVLPVGIAVVWTVWRGVRDRGAMARRNHDVHNPDQPDATERVGVVGPSLTLRVGVGPVRNAIRAAALYVAGVAVAFGPWAMKSLVETGNPVYPLAYSMFGGRDWDAELNAKWKAGHSPPVGLLKEPGRIVPDLWAHVTDVAAKSDWQSALVFGMGTLAVLALWGRRKREEGERADDALPCRVAAKRVAVARVAGVLFAYVAWLFVTWWALTHRIDRFWVPMLPVVCLLAGIGWWELLTRVERVGGRLAGGMGVWLGRVALAVPVGIAVVFNVMFVTSPLAGNNSFLLDEKLARERAMTRSIAVLNGMRLPDDARVLLVGEAELFDAEFEHVYNTVFDRSIFEEWCRTSDPDAASDRAAELRPAEEIRATFREHGVTHVFVNWLEILRYREPGSYGYTDFVAPIQFQALIEMGVLERVPLDAGECLRPLDGLSDGKRAELQRFAPELQLVYDGTPAFVAHEMFAVRFEQETTERTEVGR